MVNIEQTIFNSEPTICITIFDLRFRTWRPSSSGSLAPRHVFPSFFQISPANLKKTGRNVVKKNLLFVCLLVLWSLTLLAQTRKSPRTAHTTEKSAIHVPPDDVPLGLTKIYSNLAKSNTDLYLSHNGWIVLE